MEQFYDAPSFWPSDLELHELISSFASLEVIVIGSNGIAEGIEDAINIAKILQSNVQHNGFAAERLNGRHFIAPTAPGCAYDPKKGIVEAVPEALSMKIVLKRP